MINIKWFVHESAGLKQDCFGEIKSFSMKYSLLYIKRSKTFPQMGSKDTVWRFFKFCLSLFWWTRTMFAFFNSLGKFPFLKQDWKISSSSLQIGLPHFFNMQMLIISWPWALLGSRLWIIVAMPLQLKYLKHSKRVNR